MRYYKLEIAIEYFNRDLNFELMKLQLELDSFNRSFRMLSVVLTGKI